MAIEIERKFLLRSSEWCASAIGSARLRQAYLAQDGGLSTRVRLIDATAATLTIKSRKAGLRRLEFEFPIPLADAEALLALRRAQSSRRSGTACTGTVGTGRSMSSRVRMPA